MSDNPFSEPADSERTVIRPMPGGRRTMPQPAASLPPRTAPAPAESSVPVPLETGTPAISVSPLVAAASPLLQLLVRLRGLRQPPNPQRLRERVAGELRAFERRAREAGIKMDLLRPAHFALCASMDDVVLNTPWGASSGWGSQPLVATFHEAAGDTDQFLEQLQKLRKDPGKFLPVIELMYLCLSLGFMGRYRHARGGTGELEQLRGETHAIIAGQRGAADPDLSRRWRSAVVPYQPSRGRFPVWVAVVAALAVCGGLFFWVSASLNAASDALQTQVFAAPPSRMPDITRAAVVQPVAPPPAPAEPDIVDQLRGLLKPEIDKGLVSVLGTATTPIIRIADRGMFASGSATLQAASVPLLDRIGAALKHQPGSVRVLAYTDNQPIRTVQFPSNFQLSAARAHAVQTVIARSIGDPARVSAEGRADADPVAPNTTAAGREQNRRIEIVFRRQD